MARSSKKRGHLPRLGGYSAMGAENAEKPRKKGGNGNFRETGNVAGR
jgi:hypothetical protein